MSAAGLADFKIDFQAIRAKQLLDQKTSETVAKCGIAGLGATLVSNSGDRMLWSVAGVRKLGATGTANDIEPQDRWCLGSISKPITGTVIGILIQERIGGLSWKTKLREVFPEMVGDSDVFSEYMDVPLEVFMAHASGMPYNPFNEPHDQWYPSDPAVGQTYANLMERRRQFLWAAVKDKPAFPPGQGAIYGGGTIICAAMFEKRTGIPFEHLLKQHLYDPLGMVHSGWGVTSPGDLDGPWQHEWHKAVRTLVPSESTHAPSFNFQSHGVAGSYCVSAPDMGIFIREHLRPDPQVMTTDTRDYIQSHLPAKSNTTSGAWGCQDTDHPDTADIWHNGENGSMYADLIIHRTAHWGSAACSSVNQLFANPAVYDMQAAMNAMMTNWDALFSDPNAQFWECAHPAPALATGAGGSCWLFTRKHTGAMVRRRIPVTGPAEAPIEFPAGVFISGIGAAGSADGKTILAAGRGTDNRIWRVRSSDGGASWEGFDPILDGTFLTGPAVAMDGPGHNIHVVATGMDSKIYCTRSTDGGANWSNWQAIGAGVFNSQPALTCAADGNILHVFGRGLDHRIWSNASISSGVSWNAHWQPIGEGLFTSGPGAACSSGGTKVYVMGRGTDRAIWYNISSTNGATWNPHWAQVKDGTLTSSPAIHVTSAGMKLILVGLSTDFCPWSIRSADDGVHWSGWQQIGSEYYL